MESIWVLTTEYNEYDQYGEYFVTAFKDKPTAAQLIEHTQGYRYINALEKNLGRQGTEYQWFNLREEALK